MSSQHCHEPEPEPNSNKEEVINKPFLKSLNTDTNSALYGQDF